MQYTLRNIPKSLDSAMRERAKREQKSLNELAVELIATGLGIHGPVKRRDLSDIAGSWAPDPEADRALRDQRRIDRDLWK